MNGTKEHNNDTVVFVSRRDLEVQTTDDQMMSAKKCRKCDLLQLK